jgi:hypothetical protein
VTDISLAASSDGYFVAEADLSTAPADVVRAAIADAKQRGATRFWAYGDTALASFGFSREGGYTRLRTPDCPAGDPLPVEDDPHRVAHLFAEGFRGIWGHKEIDPAFADRVAAAPDVVHVVLEDVGICRVDTGACVIDAPGVVPGARTTDHYLRLLAGACATIGSGEAILESWGDAPEVLSAYEALGFGLVERLDGWSLDL